MRSLFILAVLSFPLLSTAAEKLNVQPGLWELTSTTEMEGTPPLPKELLDKLTPEQRAEMEAGLKGLSGRPQVDVSRECITERDLEKPFESADSDECTQEIVRTTRTTQELRLICTGDPKGQGTFRITTPTPETMTGVLDMSVGEGAEAMTIKADIKGRWLGADCGEEADEDDYSDDDADDEGDEREDF